MLPLDARVDTGLRVVLWSRGLFRGCGDGRDGMPVVVSRWMTRCSGVVGGLRMVERYVEGSFMPWACLWRRGHLACLSRSGRPQGAYPVDNRWSSAESPQVRTGSREFLEWIDLDERDFRAIGKVIIVIGIVADTVYFVRRAI